MRKARTALGSSSEWNLGDNGIPITIQPELQCSVCDEWGREALPLLLVMFHPCILRCLLLKAHHRTTTYLRNRKGKSTLQTGKQKSDSSMSLKEVVSCQGLPYPWGYNWNLKLPWLYQGTGTVESLSFPLLWYLSHLNLFKQGTEAADLMLTGFHRQTINLLHTTYHHS